MKRFCRKGYVKAFFAILIATACAGCAQYMLVENGKRIQVGNAFKVDTSINWSRNESGDIETWTVDGPQLQRLVFLKGIPDGKPLIKGQESKSETIPTFHSSMTSVEVMELFVATLARTGGHDVKTSDLRPYKLGSRDGFRFEFRYVTKQGLRYQGFVAGAQKDQKLFGIMYVGTALYHFEKHHREVEEMLASLSVL